jgi:UDP-GlcNAc3NAcA epimerase
MKLVSIVGARPQFIKAATVSRAIDARNNALPSRLQIDEVVLHTGQHHDSNMSEVFFDELDLSAPKYNLGISGGSHGDMTGRMLAQIERVLLFERPDWVIVYGDTNSTLAGALAAAKIHVPIAHVEAGLRSFNNRMPEEINRILTDRVSTLLFCPTETAVKNLAAEGMLSGVRKVGDVMFDASLYYRERANARGGILRRLKLRGGDYVLATCHRAENTDDVVRLSSIFRGLRRIAADTRVVIPLHPRARKLADVHGLSHHLLQCDVIEPVSYLDMVQLEQGALAVITDSGGVQKEAFFFGVPCLTVRDETEWVETVESGWNILCGANTDRIVAAWLGLRGQSRPEQGTPYGDGHAAEEILKDLTG